ncbi:phosphatidylinositol 5-phosphate 4-kinase type-2 alpha isoform X2 [Lates japonicus]|uniref:Phosphatidylinositol 5-phosphate 4-kinase type-2 alpha n=1 Tax=Lates japonicus TaxID=270547 RepID=A0AAD3MJU1_LATJO|nr:phosphatidylinositol 5-phosphate 4-kinase type-2 alpha isoform X2 [Lates japonicus]
MSLRRGGSTVAREASDKEKQPPPPEDVPPRPKSGNVQQRLQTLRIATRFYCAMKHAKELPTYKDNDFINDGQKIYIDEENKKMFLEKLRKDVEFLAQLKLMDYSLLVGIH